MPRYEQHCGSCGVTYDVYRPMALSSDPYVCERCDKVCRRVYSAPAFTDRPTSPAIMRDPISRGLPGSSYQ